MKIIDGRNPNATPTTLTEEQFNALLPERIATYSPEWKSRTEIYIYQIGGRFVPSAYRDGTLILCAEYKTERGVNNWLARNFPHAIRKEEGKCTK